MGHGVAECSNPLTMIRLVRAGHCATILPLSALPVDEAIDDLHPVVIQPQMSRSLALCTAVEAPQQPALLAVQQVLHDPIQSLRSEERRLGKECVSTHRYRWAANHK